MSGIGRGILKTLEKSKFRVLNKKYRNLLAYPRMGLLKLKIVSQFVPVVRPLAMVGACEGFRRSILKKKGKNSALDRIYYLK